MAVQFADFTDPLALPLWVGGIVSEVKAPEPGVLVRRARPREHQPAGDERPLYLALAGLKDRQAVLAFVEAYGLPDPTPAPGGGWFQSWQSIQGTIRHLRRACLGLTAAKRARATGRPAEHLVGDDDEPLADRIAQTERMADTLINQHLGRVRYRLVRTAEGHAILRAQVTTPLAMAWWQVAHAIGSEVAILTCDECGALLQTAHVRARNYCSARCSSRKRQRDLRTRRAAQERKKGRHA